MAGKLGEHGTLVVAATNRYMGRMTWDEVASSVGVDPRSLFEVRKTDRWQAAVADVVCEMRKEAIPTAYACLVRCAEQDDVAAAKELLNRAEGAINQLHELRGPGENGAVVLEHKVTVEGAGTGAILAILDQVGGFESGDSEETGDAATDEVHPT